MITLRPIGMVRSGVRERRAMPPMGAPAVIEVLPEFASGLLRLEKHSHLWVLVWLDRADHELLQVVPRGVSEQDPDALHGVFAVRSPARPNPIGLTATKVLSISGPRIEVDRLDFVDGTPIIDLKPYFVSRDLVFSATNVQIGRPASREALRESLVCQALNFHGKLCVDLVLAVRMMEHFRSEILGMEEPVACRITVPLHRPCLIDAVMGMARVSPGRGSLLFASTERIRFTHQGAVCEYTPRVSVPAAPEELLTAADGSLFELNLDPDN